MRVCILGQFPPHVGGVSSHTQLLAHKLIKRGDEVYVLTYPHPLIKDINGIHVESAPTINIKGLRGFIFFISATFKLWCLIKKNHVDLVHAHFLLPPGLIAVMAGFFTGKQVAVTVHGSDIFILASNPILRILMKFVLKRTDYIATVNETIADRILELNLMGVKDKIQVTPNAVDINKFNPHNPTSFAQELNLSPSKSTILFVGNLVHQKGLKYLLKAKKLLKSHAELIIVGDGSLRTELQEMVNDQKIKAVIFVGERLDVNLILPAADLFVLPSISEGLPMSLLEAFASGLPVVATAVGGIPDLVTPDVGILVKPRDPVSLAKAMDQILQDDDLRHRMKNAARKKALIYAALDIPY